MTDEHVKLVAKIQHFYDVMIRRLESIEDDSLSSINDLESISYKEKSVELKYLKLEFFRTFESFLYTELSEK